MDEFDLFEADLKDQRRTGFIDGAAITAALALILVLALVAAGVL